MKKIETAPAPADARVHVRWLGEQRFDMGDANGPRSRIDASEETGPGPIGALLGALATCAAIDVLAMLTKARTPVESLTVDVTGERVPTIPRRLRRITLHYSIRGAGIERALAERAVALALATYCSVRGSLNPGIAIESTVTVTGAVPSA
jgi:putative redox protein